MTGLMSMVRPVGLPCLPLKFRLLELAQERLAVLADECPITCKERRNLKKAIKRFESAN